jgi:hypothetical protein
MKGRERQLVAGVAIALVAIVGWLAVVAPARDRAASLASQIDTERVALSTARQAVEAGLAAQAQAKSYVAELRSLQAAVPPDEQVPQLIDELQAAATRTHVEFNAVTLTSGQSATAASATAATGASATGAAAGAGGAAAQPASTFPSENFNLTFNGRYFSVAALLGQLAGFVHADNTHFHATGRLINISSVTLGPGPHGYPAVSAQVAAQDFDVPTAVVNGGTAG